MPAAAGDDSNASRLAADNGLTMTCDEFAGPVYTSPQPSGGTAMPTIRLRPILHSLMLLALLVAAPAAYAQPPIEKQMTPEQFKAAGLDKLSPTELANLNGWLNNTLEVEASKAAQKAQEKVETENRGFFSFGKSDPIIAKIPGEFRGFAKGRNWTLDNGQTWEQVDDASLVGVHKTDPQVKITPSIIGNAWYMQIEGYNTRASVRRIK